MRGCVGGLGAAETANTTVLQTAASPRSRDIIANGQAGASDPSVGIKIHF